MFFGLSLVMAIGVTVRNGYAQFGGPPGASVDGLVVDPSAPTTLYATVSVSGVFKSMNGGASWVPANSGLNCCVSSLAIDPSTPATLYAAGAAGLFKTTNGGASWTAINSGLPASQFQHVVIDPTTPAILYAGGSDAVFKSTNGGTSWTSVSSGLPPSHITALAIDPSAPATIYAATFSPGAVFKSTNGGATWTQVLSSAHAVLTAAIAPSTPATVYAGTSGGVLRTTNGGASWTNVNSGLGGRGIRSLAIDPSNSATLYAGTALSGNGGIFKSTNAGTNWTAVNSGLTSTSDVEFLVIDPSTPTTLYAGTEGGGVFKSINAATSWSAVNSGLASTWVLALATDPSASFTLYAATFGGSVFKTANGGASWSGAGAGITDTRVHALAVDPSNTATLYAGTGFGGGVFKSTNGGATWSFLSFGVAASAVWALVIDPSTPATLYAGTFTGVFKSTNEGASWTAINSGLPSAPVQALALDPSAPATVYAGTNGSGVFKSTNGGASWTAVNPGLTNAFVRTLAVDPFSPATLYAGTGDGGCGGCNGNGVFKSTNGGASWTAVNSGLTAPSIWALAIDPSTPTTLFAGALPGGVFKSINAGASWVAANSGLTRPLVSALAIDHSNPDTLYAGTNDGGVFKSINGGATWQPTGAATEPSSPAALVSETIPDNTVVLPGQSYSKTWTLRNTGTSTWTSGYALQYFSGNAGCNHGAVAVIGTVAPHTNYAFTINCTAPTGLSTYREDWRLVAPGGTILNVGSSSTIWVRILTRTTAATSFRFDPIDSPKGVNSPFSIRVTAIDASGARVQSFSGDVALSSNIVTSSGDSLDRRSLTLTAGIGDAQVLVHHVANGVVLRASGAGLWGQSNLFTVSGPMSLVSLTVRVTDESGLPLEGALVIGTFGGLTLEQGTDEAGQTTFSSIACPTSADVAVIAGSRRAQKGIAHVRCRSGEVIQIPVLETTCARGNRTPVILLPGMIGSTSGMTRARDFRPTLPPSGQELGFSWKEWDQGPYSGESGFHGLFDPLQDGRPGNDLGWKELYRALHAQGYRLGCTVFPAPFDWRFDLETIVDNYLKPVIDNALLVSGAQEVDIVAHSTGGLVTRAYVRRYGGARLRRLAFVGVPNEGAVKAYFLYHGGDVDRADEGIVGSLVGMFRRTVAALMNDAGKAALRICGHSQGVPVYCPDRLEIRKFVQLDIPSGRDLLPVFPFLRQPGESGATGIPAGDLDNSWLRDLNVQHSSSQFAGVTIGIFGGDGRSTYGTIHVRDDDVYVFGGPVSNSRDGDGDGTVLKSSLTAVFSNAHAEIKEDIQHSELIQPHIFGEDGIVMFLTGQAAEPPALVGPGRLMGVPTLFEVSVSGPAVALVTRGNLSSGVTSQLEHVFAIPGTDVTMGAGLMSISAPFLVDQPLTVQFTSTGSGHYDVALTLVADEIETRNFRFHTSFPSRTLSLSWNQGSGTWTVNIGAVPPASVISAPAGGMTQVTWSAVAGATGYRVFRRRHGLTSFELAATLDGSTTAWISPDDPWSATAGVPTAEFAVSTIVGGNESEFSAAIMNNDQDTDGLTDDEEASMGTSPTQTDSDTDGLSDWLEHEIGTNPLLVDSDGDGLSDGLELQVGSDPQRADITTGPTPVISRVSPTPVVAGLGVILVVRGSAFFDGVSVVRVAGQSVPTLFVNGSELQASVSAAALCPPGPCTVTVENPAPGGGLSVAFTFQVRAASPELVQNGNFSGGLTNWLTHATPDISYIVSDVVNGVLEFTRTAPPPGTANQATIFQTTGTPLASGTVLLAQFDLGNSSSVRKRISVLVIDHDFSDLSVCTFWLPANAPLRAYGMRTHTTKAWTNAAIYFYAATTGTDGGAYQIDNVSLQVDPSSAMERTDCIDPTAPPPPGGPTGAELIANGDFSGVSLAPWLLDGQIVHQLSGGVFEFYRPPGTPAGVIFQTTGVAVPADEILTANVALGNSSTVRKRVTVLLHDLDFSDLSACTFWLAPGQPLTTYMMRSFATKAWTNATISVYPATVGLDQWIRLDNVTMRRTPSIPPLGTECLKSGLGASEIAPSAVVAITLPSASTKTTDAAAWTTAGDFSVSSWAAWTEAGRGWQAAEPRGASFLGWREPIDLRSATEAKLVFQSWLSSSASRADVQVSTDGVNWLTVSSVLPSDDWQPVEVDLWRFLGHVVHVQFVFRAGPPVDPLNPAFWRLDDVQLMITGRRRLQ